MAEDRRAALTGIAFEVHSLLKRTAVRDRYVKNIRDWIEAGRIANQELRERNAPIIAQVMNDEEPDGRLEEIPLDGPAPLYERPPWSVCQCYVATAVIHDAIVGELRMRTVDAVETICPAGSEYLPFRVLTVKDEAGRFFDEGKIHVGPLSGALKRVRDDLTAAGLVEVHSSETSAGLKPKRPGRKKADYETVQREAQLAADWKQARESGVYKADFAAQQGVKLKDLDKVLTRVRKRNARAGN